MVGTKRAFYVIAEEMFGPFSGETGTIVLRGYRFR